VDIHDVNLAVVGATGAVGREVIEILESRELYPKSIKFAASERSAGEKISFQGKSVLVEELKESFFSGVDIAICSAGSAVSKKFIQPEILKNTIAIDNCSYHRMDPAIPLVIPEVNSSALDQRPSKSIIANPNCTTIGMLVPLAAIHRQNPIQKIVCSSYQSVSGAGQHGIDELSSQVQALFQSQEPEPKVFPQKIAFNTIPNIGGFLSNGYSVEEQKMIDETKKILNDNTIDVAPTCVRIPTFIGHGLSLYVETKKPMTPVEIKKILAEAPGVTLMDEPTKSVYPVLADCQGQDDVFVGRVRQGMTPNSFQLWVVSDNLRKGAALNAVQILETILTKNWM
jgi:aspartate-semialdehyde dehydrogenase